MRTDQELNAEKRIGIPRGFYSYKYSILWETFFREMGFMVVFSGESNRALFQNAVNRFEKELCLPMKMYLAHIELLLDKSDFQFIPQIEMLDDGNWTCPKIIAIAEMANVLFKDRLQALTPVVRIESSSYTIGCLERIAVNTADILDVDDKTALHALRIALIRQHEHIRAKTSALNKKSPGAIRLGVIGHSYVIGDAVCNFSILEKLRHIGVELVFPENLQKKDLDQGFSQMQVYADRYWVSDFELLGAYFCMQGDPEIDGIVYLNIFGCAIDSVLEEYIQTSKLRKKKPYIKIVLDEGQNHVSMNTRLAAFLDLIQMRKGLKNLMNEEKLFG